jgi:hypothetical protein
LHHRMRPDVAGAAGDEDGSEAGVIGHWQA